MKRPQKYISQNYLNQNPLLLGTKPKFGNPNQTASEIRPKNAGRAEPNPNFPVGGVSRPVSFPGAAHVH